MMLIKWAPAAKQIARETYFRSQNIILIVEGKWVTRVLARKRLLQDSFNKITVVYPYKTTRKFFFRNHQLAINR